MTKFLNTMLATVAVVAVTSVAHADAVTNVAKGAYLGVSAGVANTNVKYNATATGVTATAPNTVAGNTHAINASAGKSAGLFGVVAGYNFQSGSVVFGGEIYGGFDSAKVTAFDDSASGSNANGLFKATVKRQRFMGFAPRIGFMVAPNTLMYARLALETGKWKAQVSPNLDTIARDAVVGAKAASKVASTSSKGGVSFAPGLGMEVYMGKVFLRAQYSYLFGPKVTVTQDTTGYANGTYCGTASLQTFKMSQHKVEMAVGYKF